VGVGRTVAYLSYACQINAITTDLPHLCTTERKPSAGATRRSEGLLAYYIWKNLNYTVTTTDLENNLLLVCTITQVSRRPENNYEQLKATSESTARSDWSPAALPVLGVLPRM
jgi:hypothetical protein